MNVPIGDFYTEVTGLERGNSKVLAALTAWKIPVTPRGAGNGSRKYWNVDISHLEEAKAKWKLEIAEKPPVATHSRALDSQKLDEVLSRIRGIEVALNALMKLAKS